MVLWLCGAPAGPEAGLGFTTKAAAAEPGLSEEERQRFRTVARWQREMKRKKKALMTLSDRQLRNIAWGKERRASGSVMLVLDEPLEKTLGPHTVEIEVFERWLDNDGDYRGSWGAKTLVAWWRANAIEEGTHGRAKVRVVLPNTGPSFAPRYQADRELARDWYYGVQRYIETGRTQEAKKLLDALVKATEDIGVRVFLREDTFKGYIGETKVDWEEWWNEQTSGYREEMKRRADERWSKLAEQATAKMPGVFDTIPDPILLIDGKYLLTMNTVQQQGGSAKRVVKRLFQTANWLIRRQLEQMPHHVADTDDIKWGNERKPRPGELVELNEPLGKETDAIRVEWAHSYVSADGKPKAIEWFEQLRRLWARSLTEAGIDNVQTGRIPLVDREGAARAHQIVHREATIAWGPELPYRRNVIHFEMARRLAVDPAGLGSHEAVGEMLDAVEETNRQIYEAVRGSGSRVAMVEEAKRKGAAIQEALKGKKEVRDPVFLLDGRYVIAADNVTEAYQILNWAIAQIQRE